MENYRVGAMTARGSFLTPAIALVQEAPLVRYFHAWS
jgi:hypothetical protein